MRLRGPRLLTAIIGLATGVAIFVACYDAPTPPALSSGTPAQSRNAATPNRLAWVGAAHNRAIAQMLKRPDRGRSTKGNFCTSIVAALMDTPAMREIRNRPGYSDEAMAAAVRSGLSLSSCSAKRSALRQKSAHSVSFVPALHNRAFRPTSLAMQEETPPPPPYEVQVLLNQILAAVDAVTTADAFDAQIASVIQAAYQFSDTAHQEIVLSAAAVASSSFHYWEVNWEDQLLYMSGPVISDLEAGTCVDAIDILRCLEGDEYGFRSADSRGVYLATLMQRASDSRHLNAAEKACMQDYDVDGDSIKTAIKVDVGGGIAGALFGAFKGGWRGAALGAAGGAAGASFAEFMGYGVLQGYCMWRY